MQAYGWSAPGAAGPARNDGDRKRSFVERGMEMRAGKKLAAVVTSMVLVAAAAAHIVLATPSLSQEAQPELRRRFPAFRSWTMPRDREEIFIAEMAGEAGTPDRAEWSVRGPESLTSESDVERRGEALQATWRFKPREAGEYVVSCSFRNGNHAAGPVEWNVVVPAGRFSLYGRREYGPGEDPGAMVWVKGGTFLMGAPPSEYRRTQLWDDSPPTRVSVGDFYIGKYCVTTGEFCEFLNDRGNPGGRLVDVERSRTVIAEETGRYLPREGMDACPIGRVRWEGAVQYCQWLSEKSGLRYRLPTEAEWEYVARGVEARRYPWGMTSPLRPDTKDPSPARPHGFFADLGWAVFEPYRAARTVGSFPPNCTPDGVADMGLLHEWCSDVFDGDVVVGPPPADGEAVPRPVRGDLELPMWDGFWSERYAIEPAWHRLGAYPDLSIWSFSFRVVKDVEGRKKTDDRRAPPRAGSGS